MPEESTTSDLVELVRRTSEAGSRRDIDGILSFYAPGAIWDMSPVGLGVHEGAAAIRGFLEDWYDAYEEWRQELEEVLDLGKGVTFAVLGLEGRPFGSSSSVRLRYATVGVWEDARVVRSMNYSDIGEARAAPQQLAEASR
jgi:ketosteroid isomerase-like protein